MILFLELVSLSEVVKERVERDISEKEILLNLPNSIN